MTESLLSTKLYIPATRPALVHRPRLLEKLTTGLHRKMSLISAPAGFGKTTVVTEWLGNLQSSSNRGKQVEYEIAWLSLDASDNNFRRFLTYIIAALRKTNNSIGGTTLNMLQSAQLPPVEVIMTSLINEIAGASNKIIFVLDDCHLIEDQTIYDSLTFLIENSPASLHLVIVTREDPFLPLARLMARDQMTQLRAKDLRFTKIEVADFLNRVMGLDLSEDDIAALDVRTEGWIAGLQLAALSMQGRKDAKNFIKSFTGSHRLVVDYLIEEALEQQPKDIQNFLLLTSILDRLNSSMCNALTGQDNGQRTLEYLEQANLFIIPLDNVRQWYRYHHLFADVLQERLVEQMPNQVSSLHQRASEWYQQNDHLPEAIRHSMTAQDFDRAAELAELAWPDWSESFYSITWLGWLKDLPYERIRARPVLSLSFAWALLNAGDLEAAETHLKDVEYWLDLEAPSPEMIVVDDEQFRSLPVSLATARAYHAQAIGNLSNTVKYTQRVLDLLPEGDHQWRSEATVILGLAYWADGELETAYQTFTAGMAGMKPLDIIVGTFVLADMQRILGHLDEAINTCERALQLASDHGEIVPLGTEDVYSGMSELHRERGHLQAAVQDLAKCKQLGEKIELPDWQYRYYIAHARLKESLGDLDDSLSLLEEADRVFVRTPLPVVRPIPAMKARVWIKQREFGKVERWVRELNLSADDDLSYLREFEYVTLAKLFIARNFSADAVDLLERLLNAAEEGKRIASMIEILVLLALALDAQGELAAALVPLEHALKLAEPERFVQTFIDEGQPMARLLYEAISQEIFPDYAQLLLAAFPIAEHEQSGAAVIQTSDGKWIEPLSEREIEVLHLIAEGLTNQEIASRLFLSLHTVKGHARNIYSKLDVKNRTQAVAKGKALGMLLPDKPL